MKLIRKAFLMLCWSFALAMALNMAFASAAEQNTIKVVGAGEVVAVPDKLTFNLLLRQQGQSVSKLFASVNQNSTLIVNYLRTQKVPERDIQSMSIQVTPWLEYENQRRVQKGFELSRIISVTLNDSDRLASVLDHLFRISNVEISSVNLMLKNRTLHYQKAMQFAIESAKAKAKLIADSLSVKLGDAVSFTEISAQTFPRQESLMRTADAGNNFLPGEVAVTATVEVEFSIQ